MNYKKKYKISRYISICFLITSLSIQGCNNKSLNYNMDVEDNYIPDENQNKKNKGQGNCAILGLGCIAGICIASIIEIPSMLITKQNQISNQSFQLSSVINNFESQSKSLANAIIPILAENENAIYSLANGTNIIGISISSNNINYDDILGITSISLISNSTLYTAEEEFNFQSLTQILPSLNELKETIFSNQYIAIPINLTTTSITNIDLSGSYLNSQVIIPQNIEIIVLTNSILCSNGSIICNGGNITNTNCINQTINEYLQKFNQQSSVVNASNYCNNYNEYQQVLTNYTALVNTYQKLEAYLSYGGLEAFVNCTNYLAGNASLYNDCSNNNQYPYATNLYNTCSNNNQYPNAGNLYTTCSINNQYPTAVNNYNICSQNNTYPDCYCIIQNLPQYMLSMNPC